MLNTISQTVLDIIRSLYYSVMFSILRGIFSVVTELLSQTALYGRVYNQYFRRILSVFF